MNNAANIRAEARAAADKAAALSAYINKKKNALMAEDSGTGGGSQFRVLMELRTAYDELAKALEKRAEMEEATEARAAQDPRPVFLPAI